MPGFFVPLSIARSEATWQSTKPSQEGYGWQRSHKLRLLRGTPDRRASLAMTVSKRASLKKVFVNFFEMQNLLVAAAYIIADHQLCELVAINQHNAHQLSCCLNRRRAES